MRFNSLGCHNYCMTLLVTSLAGTRMSPFSHVCIFFPMFLAYLFNDSIMISLCLYYAVGKMVVFKTMFEDSSLNLNTFKVYIKNS